MQCGVHIFNTSLPTYLSLRLIVKEPFFNLIDFLFTMFSRWKKPYDMINCIVKILDFKTNKNNIKRNVNIKNV